MNDFVTDYLFSCPTRNVFMQPPRFGDGNLKLWSYVMKQVWSFPVRIWNGDFAKIEKFIANILIWQKKICTVNKKLVVLKFFLTFSSVAIRQIQRKLFFKSNILNRIVKISLRPKITHVFPKLQFYV